MTLYKHHVNYCYIHKYVLKNSQLANLEGARIIEKKKKKIIVLRPASWAMFEMCAAS